MQDFSLGLWILVIMAFFIGWTAVGGIVLIHFLIEQIKGLFKE